MSKQKKLTERQKQRLLFLGIKHYSPDVPIEKHCVIDRDLIYRQVKRDISSATDYEDLLEEYSHDGLPDSTRPLPPNTRTRVYAPSFGRFLLCLFISPEKQEDRLADFEEMLNTIWIPHFGSRIGRLIYMWHAGRSAGAIVWIGFIAAIVDRIRRAFGW